MQIPRPIFDLLPWGGRSAPAHLGCAWWQSIPVPPACAGCGWHGAYRVPTPGRAYSGPVWAHSGAADIQPSSTSGCGVAAV